MAKCKKKLNIFSYRGVYVWACVLLCVNITNCIEHEETEELTTTDNPALEEVIDKEINNIDNPKKTNNYGGYVVGKIVQSMVPMHSDSEMGRMFSFSNTSFRIYGENSMWDELFRDCGAKTALSCVKKSVYTYIDKSISTDGDFPITDSLIFTRNGKVFENKYGRSLNLNKSSPVNRTLHEGGFNESAHTENSSFSSFTSLTNSLYDKGVKFIMSHDLELQLPEMFFEGATLKISPKALEGDGGALIKLEVNNRNDVGDGRILFKKHKKKLMMAFFAILMVVKMIKVKVMFLAPVLLGVGTAKKLFLKLLLFVFPAFAQIFKFCAYYHAAHTKYHHHHHQIAHHHHHVPVPVPVHVDHSHMPVHLDHPPPEISYESPSGPPSGHGGGWGSSNFISRNELLGPHQIEENELESWGLMSKGSFSVPASALYPQSHPISFPAFLEDPKINRNSYLADATTLLHQKPVRQGPVPTPHQIPSPVYVPSEEELLKQQKLLAARQQLHRKVVPHSPTNGIVHQNIQVSRPLLVAGDKTSEQKLALAKLQQQQHQIETLKHQQQMMLERQEQEFLKHRNHIENLQLTTEASTVAVTYDPFYSPILQKMDNVFVQLGFNEEACRERLVCSMYKTPARFSPHSNLISAELSRDPQELQKPAVPNSASVRFHRYVQSARDGQEQKDCLRLYPACTVKTE